ncbi:MAG TPA: dihydrodipicolinate reductase C-terminal domain-containing protein [Pyrinomonadaceae bacterium]|nr:dihydrodipicolinate reductase C-terminal domain-containing protein [Pyrinomonadaceae bacterium]
MKLAIIGYGAMGQLVAKLAAEQGHEVVATLTSANTNRSVDELSEKLGNCDVAIDFSVAAAVPKNVEICARAGVPLVEGTTGWKNQLDQVKRVVVQHDGALIHGANFSVGVQVFYRIAARAAELFRALDSYDAFIEEAHHKRKRDAPSGTAIQLQEMITEALGREVPVASTRAGHIPGTHRLGFDSAADQITLTHTARSREGFAAGALLAARWIMGRKGVFEFSEVFEEIVKPQSH